MKSDFETWEGFSDHVTWKDLAGPNSYFPNLSIIRLAQSKTRSV